MKIKYSAFHVNTAILTMNDILVIFSPVKNLKVKEQKINSIKIIHEKSS